MTGSLADLLHDQLRDLHDAEAQYIRLLPRMIKKATHTTLREFLISTEEQTHENLSLLSRVCSMRGICADGLPCMAMDGLVREFRRHASDAATLDATIIANAHRIAHYEIAGFVTAGFFARSINATEASRLLASLADAAGARDQALTRIGLGEWYAPAACSPSMARPVPAAIN